MTYAYFVANPNELRHDVRDNFEEFLQNIPEGMQKNRQTDDRPIAEQALGMMDQLKAFEEMMGTSTFGAKSLGSVESGSVEEPPTPVTAPPHPTPTFPSIELD